MNPGEQTAQEFPVFIVTTSKRKFDHLTYLNNQTSKTNTQDLSLYWLQWEYEEIQSDNMELLLDDAMSRSVFDKIRDDAFFIIEQTSVFLDAKGGEGPGQYFKKWWKTKGEEELRMILSRNEGATIESGLALNIPGHEPLIFTNTQRGKISLDGSINQENQKYSWLSQDDFNLYFIPEGANKVYNEMGIREFDRYDFRRDNFEKVAQRLGEYISIIQSNITIEDIYSMVENYYDGAGKSRNEGSQSTSTQSRLDDL